MTNERAKKLINYKLNSVRIISKYSKNKDNHFIFTIKNVFNNQEVELQPQTIEKLLNGTTRVDYVIYHKIKCNQWTKTQQHQNHKKITF